MRSICITLCIAVLAAACVDLNKPRKVILCEAKGDCVNVAQTVPTDGGTATDGGTVFDGTAAIGEAGPAPGRDMGSGGTPDGTRDSSTSNLPDGEAIARADTMEDSSEPDSSPDSTDTMANTPDANTNPDTVEVSPPRSDALDGSAATCMLGGEFLPADTICRASTDGNRCDPPEHCTGASASCPADVFYRLPALPEGVSATPGTLQATIAWNAASGATGYNVKRSTSSGSGYTALTSSPTTAASYTDQGLSGGVAYYYVVASVNTIGTCESPNSAPVTATPTSVCTPPAAPAITATAGNSSVTLNWAAVPGATAYRVSRNTTGTGAFTEVSTPTIANYLDSPLTNGTSYYYVVAASNGSCWSANSAVVSATPSSPPYGVYDDALRNGWENWSWGGTYTLNDATPVQSGSASISVIYTAGYAGFQLHNNVPISTVGKTAFTFWAHGGVTGSKRVRFWIKNAADIGSPNTILNIPAGIWTKFTVSLVQLGIPAAVKEILFQDDTGGTQAEFNIDQIELD